MWATSVEHTSTVLQPQQQQLRHEVSTSVSHYIHLSSIITHWYVFFHRVRLLCPRRVFKQLCHPCLFLNIRRYLSLISSSLFPTSHVSLVDLVSGFNSDSPPWSMDCFNVEWFCSNFIPGFPKPAADYWKCTYIFSTIVASRFGFSPAVWTKSSSAADPSTTG